MLDSIVGTLALVLVCYGVIYFFVTLGTGVRVLHREKKLLDHQARQHRYEAKPRASGAPQQTETPDPGYVYFLVPCLNEEAVIGATVRDLLAQHPHARIVVIDDDSDDDTARIALTAGEGRFKIVRRRAPDAQLGKGPALNAGLRVIADDVAERALDPSRVIVGVMDADGRLSVGAVDRILEMFDTEPALGGVQLAVRIRNRDRVITRIQDFEFWGLSAVTQMGRKTTGTVGLGGNGQFSRLCALASLQGDPWSDSLTEDLDLGVSLLVAGWKLSTTSEASVDQEGVDSIGRLLKQRTRWFQGHMTCGKRIGELWLSPNLSNLASLEICLNLLVPWVLLLFWSVIIHLVYYRTVLRWTSSGTSVYGNTTLSIAGFVVFLYILSFLPNIIAGIVYYRRDPDVSLGKGLFYGHFSVVVNYLYYYACWRAFLRILLGKSGWTKTTRTADARRVHPVTRLAPISWRAPADWTPNAVAPRGRCADDAASGRVPSLSRAPGAPQRGASGPHSDRSPVRADATIMG